MSVSAALEAANRSAVLLLRATPLSLRAIQYMKWHMRRVRRKINNLPFAPPSDTAVIGASDMASRGNDLFADDAVRKGSALWAIVSCRTVAGP